MLTFIVWVGIWFVLGWIINFFTKDWDESSNVLVTVIGSFVVTILLFGGLMFYTQDHLSNVLESKHRIYAMQDNQIYIVSRNSVNSSQRYYYMIDTDKGFKSYYAEESKSYINYTTGSPYVEIYKQVYKGNKIIEFLIKGTVCDSEYNFYVPKGTIKEDYSIDLK